MVGPVFSTRGLLHLLEIPPMTFALVATSSVLAVLLALGWAKEFRLRRALQNLMTRILTCWRNAHEEVYKSSTHRDVSGTARDDRRMR